MIQMARIYKFTFLFAVVAMLYGCGGSTPYDGPEQMHEFTVEIDQVILLNQFAAHRASTPQWSRAIHRLGKKHADDASLDLASELITIWEEQNGDMPISKILHTREYADKFPAQASNQEIADILRNELYVGAETIQQIIKARCQNMGSKAEITKVGSGGFAFKVKVSSNLPPTELRKMVETSGLFEIYETFDNTEMYQAIESVDLHYAAKYAEIDSAVANVRAIFESDSNSTDMSVDDLLSNKEQEDAEAKAQKEREEANPLFSKMILAVYDDPSRGFVWENGCRVGSASVNDTLIVNRMLNAREVKYLYPKGLRLVWEANVTADERGEYVSLYAIKIPETGNAKITGDLIMEASSSVARNREFDFDDVTVTLLMNSTGAERWQLMTSRNIGKALVIMLDGKVLNAPIVQSEITGGATEVSMSDERGAWQMAAILNAGAYPGKTGVVKVIDGL